jgi:hypothetical protein
VKFIPGDLIIYFDTTSIMVFTAFLWMTSLVVMGCHWLEIRATEMQFNAQCLGKWNRYIPQQIEPTNESSESNQGEAGSQA